MAESRSRFMLQFKAKLSQSLVVAGEPGPGSGGVVTVPPGRLSIKASGEIQSASPTLAWLGQTGLEGRVIINTDTGDLFLTLYLDD